MKRPVREWRPSGWRGARTIEYELYLPGGMFARVWRRKDKLWDWAVGDFRYPRIGHQCIAVRTAQLCAERELLAQAQATVILLKRRGK